MNTTAQGKEAENKAAAYLQQKGCQLLARNYRKHCGEIDLIVLDGKTLVFVEVKSRMSNSFGGPLAAVTPGKQLKIAKTAVWFIKEHAIKFDSIRFDVIALLDGQITHIPHAFIPQRGIL